jgi:hypothetical protein
MRKTRESGQPSLREEVEKRRKKEADRKKRLRRRERAERKLRDEGVSEEDIEDRLIEEEVAAYVDGTTEYAAILGEDDANDDVAEEQGEELTPEADDDDYTLQYRSQISEEEARWIKRSSHFFSEREDKITEKMEQRIRGDRLLIQCLDSTSN